MFILPKQCIFFHKKNIKTTKKVLLKMSQEERNKLLQELQIAEQNKNDEENEAPSMLPKPQHTLNISDN